MNVNNVVEKLSNVKYHDLSEALKELGLGDIWKPGVKKDLLIKAAIDKAKAISVLEGKGLSKEDIDKELEIQIEVNKIEEEKLVSANASKIVEAEVQAKLDEKLKAVKSKSEEVEVAEVVQSEEDRIRGMKLSLEDLEKVNHNITANLKNNIPTQRTVLLMKRAIVEKLILEAGDNSTTE